MPRARHRVASPFLLLMAFALLGCDAQASEDDADLDPDPDPVAFGPPSDVAATPVDRAGHLAEVGADLYAVRLVNAAADPATVHAVVYPAATPPASTSTSTSTAQEERPQDGMLVVESVSVPAGDEVLVVLPADVRDAVGEAFPASAAAITTYVVP